MPEIKCLRCDGTGEIDNTDSAWDNLMLDYTGNDYVYPDTLECPTCKGKGTMTEITPDDLKWINKIDTDAFRRKWNATINLDGETCGWVVSKIHDNTAIFAVKGTYSELDHDPVVDDTVLQDTLNRYPGEALFCVDAAGLRKAIRSVKPKVSRHETAKITIETQPSDDDLLLTGWVDDQPVKTFVKATSLIHPTAVTFEINPHTWINALMGFDNFVWVLIKPNGSGSMFVITDQGNRAAFIMSYHDSADQFKTFNQHFWQNSVHIAITRVRGLDVVTYGELLELGKSVDLSFYQEHGYSPEEAAYELAFNLDQLKIEETACLTIGDTVRNVTDLDETKTYLIQEFHNNEPDWLVVDGKSYPLQRKNLRLVK